MPLHARPQKHYANSRLKIHIAKHKDGVNRVLRVCSVVVSLATIAGIVCYHGLYITERAKDFIRWAIYGSLFFYVVKYFIRLFYSLHRAKFLKRSWFECIIICLLTIQFILYFVFDFDLRIGRSADFENYYILFIQFYFLVIVLIEMAKMSGSLGKFHVSPPMLMVASFFLLILAGTVLLSLPRMTTDGISVIDALFTATSASCVTGLTTMSTVADFTVKGQIVIMLLMQFGGISILSFATFFTTFLSQSYQGLRYQYLVKDMLSTERIADSVSMLRSIVLTTFVIELSGAALLFTYWKTTGFFTSDTQNLFHSAFYAVAAFNNGGFTTMDGSLMDIGVAGSYFPQTVIMLLVLLGGIGFVVIQDFFSIPRIRERHRHRWKEIMPQTKIILITTFYVILIGSAIFFLLEKDNALAGQKTLFDKIFVAVCQIVTSRTAGFTVMDISLYHIPTLILIMCVIFIGGSPGSTSGGIKTTTLFVLVKSVFATIKGKKHIEFRHRTIPFSLVDKASSIVIMSFLFVLLSGFVFSILEPELGLETAIFQVTSAFTTCGLSLGSCTALGAAAKVLLILDMYIGRVGTLTLAFALTKRRKESKHQYPDMNLMIG